MKNYHPESLHFSSKIIVSSNQQRNRCQEQNEKALDNYQRLHLKSTPSSRLLSSPLSLLIHHQQQNRDGTKEFSKHNMDELSYEYYDKRYTVKELLQMIKHTPIPTERGLLSKLIRKRHLIEYIMKERQQLESLTSVTERTKSETIQPAARSRTATATSVEPNELRIVGKMPRLPTLGNRSR
jgi:hypothetical protein